MAMTTLLDIAKANGHDQVVGLIDETTKAHPELAAVAARTIKGNQYKTLVRIALPTVNFRNANEGVTPSKGNYDNRLVETYIFNPRWECDKAVADSYEDGAPAYIAMEADATMEAAAQALCKQFYYGIANDAKGFPGLIASYDATNMVVDAGGTTDNVASSVWAIKFGPQAVQWVFGMNGQLAMSELKEERVLDSNNKPYTAYTQELLARPGLQVGSIRAVARIKKLTTDSGKGLTDSLLADLLAKFDVGVVPDAILMNRRTRAQLQKGRTVTLFGNSSGKPTGANATLAPLPTEYEGIPILVTDAITNTEALAL